ncbi:Hypothetical protein PENO1_069030 [Penicillium occitanis (nom. inval.)]|nr:Hypothetical protein PENO1_069030 [Penicillium occitanis (nom. inval.)]PCG96625.1 hypothetical protein PENOC_072020 [Penicillium occitanis (nom. inval.)]
MPPLALSQQSLTANCPHRRSSYLLTAAEVVSHYAVKALWFTGGNQALTANLVATEESKGLTCYGYRLPEALRIRDQTDEVTRRLQECEQPVDSRASPSRSDDTHLPTRDLAPSASDLKDQGLCYFMSYYGRPLSETITDNTSYTIFTKEATDDPIVLAVSTAIGLAALANIHHDDSLAIQARQSYSAVIGSLSQALQVPLYAASDSALITSLLLSIFEVTHCIQRGTKVPEFFREWPSRALPGLLSADYLLGEDLTCLSIKLTNLNAVLREASIKDYGSLLKAVHSIDEQLAQWGALFHDKSGYTIIDSISVIQNCRRPLIELPTEKFYVYRNAWSCNHWNIYRILRIMANGFALAMVDKLPEDSVTTYSRSKCKDVVNDMAWGILASVPYCLGAIGNGNLIGEASPTNALGALNNFKKLYLFGTMPYVSETLRIKAVKTLRQIGEIYGIRFSSLLAETMER